MIPSPIYGGEGVKGACALGVWMEQFPPGPLLLWSQSQHTLPPTRLHSLLPSIHLPTHPRSSYSSPGAWLGGTLGPCPQHQCGVPHVGLQYLLTTASARHTFCKTPWSPGLLPVPQPIQAGAEPSGQPAWPWANHSTLRAPISHLVPRASEPT